MNPSVTAIIFFIESFLIGIIASEISCLSQPSCKDKVDGAFPNFVCKGEGLEARCFCCSVNNPERIFGWSWTSSAENMTCSCSRQRKEIGRIDVSIHCAENGNYDELQCDNDLCWCVEPMSGKPTERFYPRSMRRYLPCYLRMSDNFRQNYERMCESGAIAIATVLRKFEAHGTYGTHIDWPQCDYDGSYSARKIDGKSIHCVWKDEKQIGGYVTDVANFNTTNCYCARDSIIYGNKKINFFKSCVGDGNYDSSQTSNGRPYCVDEDGFATTTLGSIGEVLKCQNLCKSLDGDPVGILPLSL